MRERIYEQDSIRAAIQAYESLAHHSARRIEQTTGQASFDFMRYYNLMRLTKLGRHPVSYLELFAHVVALCEDRKISCYDYIKSQFAQWPGRSFDPRRARVPVPFPRPEHLLGAGAWRRYCGWTEGHTVVPKAKQKKNLMESGLRVIENMMRLNPKRYPTVQAVLENENVVRYLPPGFVEQIHSVL